MALAKTGAALAVAIPAKTAVAAATRGLMNRSAGTGGAVPKPTAEGKGGPNGDLGKKGASANKQGAGTKARQIQQIGNQGKRDRVTENVSKAHDKYTRQRDRTQEGKERFMQGGRQRTGGAGMKDQSGNRQTNKA